jgi:hypothetical protein
VQEILSPNTTSSAAFVIPHGEQITLYAKGLAGSDTVVVEILELSSAPTFSGNLCCDLQKHRIEVVRRVPLLCPNGKPVTLTAAYPWGVLSSPQGLALGVRLVADPAAAVTVELHQSANTGCVTCICDRPCVDATWSPTGETRCVNNMTQKKETSNCGTERWVATTTACGYCPSMRLSCNGEPGYGFHLLDPKDPAATVELASCDGTDSIWIYPTAGPGHTAAQYECKPDGTLTLLGYGANRSDCAPDCGC